MGFFDTFKGKQYKSETERLQAEVNRLNSLLTPEMQNSINMQNHISGLQNQIDGLNSEIDQRQLQINNQNQQISALNQQIRVLNDQIQSKELQIFKLDEEIQLQDFGIYRPRFDFANSDQYKKRLDFIRDQQKAMIKNEQAVTGNMGWTVNGNASKGKKMVKDMQKLLLRAFNSECDELVDKVKYNNFDSFASRMRKSYEAISNLGYIMSVSITPAYFDLKLQELSLALEYRQKKQAEKEEQKEIRARMREEAKLQKEIEETRKKIQKEQSHYRNALKTLETQLESVSEENKADLIAKRNEILQQLGEIDKSLKDIDYREANAKAGYVYIISNIGSFGENVYKIGMTRRLDPMDRVDELGDASVPFNFDVHALIFSDNAPALEAALHKAFETRKVNMINQRREFFNVTLEEIEAVVRANYDKTVEFIRFAPAEQFRESLKIKESSAR